jgi:hypothetical protein
MGVLAGFNLLLESGLLSGKMAGNFVTLVLFIKVHVICQKVISWASLNCCPLYLSECLRYQPKMSGISPEMSGILPL